MRLSKVQQDILDKMHNGWELGLNGGIDVYCRIQKGGLGRGGEVKTVSCATLWALQERGLIERASEKYPTVYYKLTNKGRRLT